MLAIYKREMQAYFKTGTGYLFIIVSILLSGVTFSLTTLFQNTSNTSNYFTIMLFMFLIMLPILTMKSFSEERKTKTEQLLLTSPVSLTGMVGGKFLAALSVFAGTMLLTCFQFFALFRFAGSDDYGRVLTPNVTAIIGNMIALLLVGTCFLAIGLFVSSLTENQFAAAVITIAVLLALLLLNVLNSYIGSAFIRSVLSWLSIYGRYQNFSYGIFDFAALLYYLSVAFVFLFLTVRVYDRRRWN